MKIRRQFTLRCINQMSFYKWKFKNIYHTHQIKMLLLMRCHTNNNTAWLCYNLSGHFRPPNFYLISVQSLPYTPKHLLCQISHITALLFWCEVYNPLVKWYANMVWMCKLFNRWVFHLQNDYVIRDTIDTSVNQIYIRTFPFKVST